MITMKEKPFVDFILLHGYSLDNFGLMFGKMGCSLSLFEFSRKYHDELAEKYAYELLQEVLAFSLNKNTFDEGKMGIAWALIYLIRNQYIDAEYLELYRHEHDEILAYVKQIRSKTVNAISNVDAISFLENLKSYIPKTELEESLYMLTEGLSNYLRVIPSNVFECNTYYYVGCKILGFYNCHKDIHFGAKRLLDAIVQTHITLTNKGYICNNLSFGVNLLQYGLSQEREDVVAMSNEIIECCISNIVFKAFDLRNLIDTIYNLNKLQVLNRKSEWFPLKEELSGLLYNKSSYLYKTGRFAMHTLKEGIPRLIFMECLSEQKLDYDGHYIMLQ